MEEFKRQFIKLFETAERPEYRDKMLKRCARNVARLGGEAIALDEEERRCIDARDDLRARDLPRALAGAESRVTLVHRARCDKLRDVAQQVALIMKYACGDLRVDEETAWTGLRREDRQLIDAMLNIEVSEE